MKRLPHELKYHGDYPIYKKGSNGYSIIINPTEAYSIQPSPFGEGLGFKFRHFISRTKVLDILTDRTISEIEFKEGTSALVKDYLEPLKLILSSQQTKLLSNR
jgi:hypothetical protein